MLKLEPDLDTYYHILESDERSKADVHIFQNSATSSPSYPPLAATYRRVDSGTSLQSRGGKEEWTLHAVTVARLDMHLGHQSAP